MTEAPDREPPELLSVARMLDDITARLSPRFAGIFTRATIARYVHGSYDALVTTSRIPEVVPALTARFAADRLTALARAQGLMEKPMPEVLFVCDRNAGRSQMAAALLVLHGAGRVHVHSAGTRPSAELELHIVEAMGEIGADLSAEYPKPLTDEIVQAADIVVTVGCGDAYPVLPGKRYLDWTVPDPDGRDLPEIRRIRDEIDLLVTELLGSSLPPTPDPK
jgi:arsenate reductase